MMSECRSACEESVLAQAALMKHTSAERLIRPCHRLNELQRRQHQVQLIFSLVNIRSFKSQKVCTERRSHPTEYFQLVVLISLSSVGNFHLGVIERVCESQIEVKCLIFSAFTACGVFHSEMSEDTWSCCPGFHLALRRPPSVRLYG